VCCCGVRFASVHWGGAAQSRQRYGDSSDGLYSAPTASASSASRSSRSSRMRRKRIQVSSGTYCKAPAQFDRRMMSQMDLTALLTDCCEVSLFPFVWLRAFAILMSFRELSPLNSVSCDLLYFLSIRSPLIIPFGQKVL